MNKNSTATSLGAIILMRPLGGATKGDELECLIAMKLRGDNEGKWVFPNGGFNAGKDRTLKGELIREVHSETGVLIKPIYPQPFYLRRTPGDGLHGRAHKLFYLCTVKEGPPLVPDHICDELGQYRYRSVRHLRSSMYNAMGNAYLRALHHFADARILDTLAQQETWEDTGIELPPNLPAEALQPLARSYFRPNELCVA